MDTKQKNNVLASLATLLETNKEAIIEVNKQDIAHCITIDKALLDRLKIDEIKIDGLIRSLHEAIALDDPEGKVLYHTTHENGMTIENRAVPFGKIFIIYESRPDVTIEAAVVAFKAGNSILLKGGKEANRTNVFLVSLWHKALSINNIDTNFVSYFDGNREQVQQLISEQTQHIDLIIPRGGEALINFVSQHAKVPIMISGRGNNFLYIHSEANIDMAIKIVLNGKNRISVCNALDKVLIDVKISDHKVKQLIEALQNASINIVADAAIVCLNDRADLPMQTIDSDPQVWETEFLSSKILLSRVDDLAQAIQQINRYSGGHSACIVTSNQSIASQFQMEIDCAAVYHNASTRFTDGGQFGFSSEIAISTQKLHFRGPVGIAQLLTNKWFISGDGQVR